MKEKFSLLCSMYGVMNFLIALSKRRRFVFYPIITSAMLYLLFLTDELKLVSSEARRKTTTAVWLRCNEVVMGCIKHSMMFEAQLTDIFPRWKKGNKQSERGSRRRDIS